MKSIVLSSQALSGIGRGWRGWLFMLIMLANITTFHSLSNESIHSGYQKEYLIICKVCWLPEWPPFKVNDDLRRFVCINMMMDPIEPFLCNTKYLLLLCSVCLALNFCPFLLQLFKEELCIDAVDDSDHVGIIGVKPLSSNSEDGSIIHLDKTSATLLSTPFLYSIK